MALQLSVMLFLLLPILSFCQVTNSSPDNTLVQFIEREGTWVHHHTNTNVRDETHRFRGDYNDELINDLNADELGVELNDGRIENIQNSIHNSKPSVSFPTNRNSASKLKSAKFVVESKTNQEPTWKIAGLESASLTLEDDDSYGRHESPNNHLHQRRNRIRSSCPLNCRCGLITGVTCNSPSNDAPLPPSFPRGIQVLTLYGYKNINDELQNLSELQELSIYDGNLTRLPNFPRSLTHLRITNSNLKDLDNINTLPYLQSFNAAHNNLTDVNLSKLTHLLSLDLSNNPLIKVPEMPTSLTILKLRNTHLHEQPPIWTVYLPNLRQLALTGIHMTEPPKLHFEMLEYLDLSYSKLKLFPYLSGLPNLKEIDLSHIAIYHVLPDHFRGATKLKMVDLSYTHLSKLPDNLFTNNPNIKEIYMHHTDIQYIKDYTLSGLTKLKHLIIRDNRDLANIDDKSLSTLRSLKVLDISNTAVNALPLSLINLNISRILVDNVTLVCDCHSHWLPNYIASLGNHNMISGLLPVRCTDGVTRSAEELREHIDSLDCSAPDIISQPDFTLRRGLGKTALLECNATGIPHPVVIWQSPTKKFYTYNHTDIKPWFSDKFKYIFYHITDQASEPPIDPRIQPLKSGQLLIQNLTRDDVGLYRCTAVNPVASVTSTTSLWLTEHELEAFKFETMLFGLACAITFLLTTLIVQLVRFIMDRMGWECCCCRGRISSKAQQVKKLLESVESYKSQQLDRLRENYNAQVVTIKESCYQQMERLSESYTQQSKNLQNLKDYSAQQITTARDQYVEQINKVRDYSTSQMNKVSENYVFQRQRVRKFSAHQLFKLRETYKYQQKTLNKILENIPDLYLQNCRTGGGCNRADSIIFDDEIHGIDAYYRLDFLNPIITGYDDSEDFYYTPSSTLTRGQRQHIIQQHRRQHSNTSGDTAEYQEAVQSWATNTPNLSPGNSPSRPGHQPIKHTRSLSISAAVKPNYSKGGAAPTHRRTLSANIASSLILPVKVHKSSPPLVEKTYWTPDQRSPSESYYSIARIPVVLGGSSRSESDNSDCETASMLKCDDDAAMSEDQQVEEGSLRPNIYLNNSRYVKLATGPSDNKMLLLLKDDINNSDAVDASEVGVGISNSCNSDSQDEIGAKNRDSPEGRRKSTENDESSIVNSEVKDDGKEKEDLGIAKDHNQSSILIEQDCVPDTLDDEEIRQAEDSDQVEHVSTDEVNISSSLSAKRDISRKKSLSREGSKEQEVRSVLPSVTEDKEPVPSESHL